MRTPPAGAGSLGWGDYTAGGLDGCHGIGSVAGVEPGAGRGVVYTGLVVV